jgi:DNA-binding NarL/FixJ family response regulator
MAALAIAPMRARSAGGILAGEGRSEGERLPAEMEQETVQGRQHGNGKPPLRVAIADDSYLLREAIGQVLEREPGIDVVAVCSDGDELMAAVEEHHPAVVIVDIRMPPSGDDEGIAIANRLRETHPDIGVVVLSQYVDPRYGLALLEHGSDGRAYLLKERLRDREHLMAAVEAVADSGSVVDAKVVESLIAARVQAERSPLAELSGGQEQPGHRRHALPHQARGREAHQHHLHEARPDQRRRGQPAREGRPHLPRRTTPMSRPRPGAAHQGCGLARGARADANRTGSGRAHASRRDHDLPADVLASGRGAGCSPPVCERARRSSAPAWDGQAAIDSLTRWRARCRRLITVPIGVSSALAASS